MEDRNDFIDDPSYLMRIQRYMEAANEGCSLDAVRQAAESGAGVPFRIDRTGNRLVLVPLENINAAQKEGALRAAQRLSPARALIEIGTPEDFSPEKMQTIYSTSNYTGTNPQEGGMDGPNWDGENSVYGVSANTWQEAGAGTPYPGTGLPSEILSGGAWHTPPLGFGDTAALMVSVREEPVSRIKFSLSPGYWSITVKSLDVEVSEKVYGEEFFTFDKLFPFTITSEFVVTIRNIEQEENDLFLKGLYVGPRVTKENRLEWLNLGGWKGTTQQMS